MLFLSCLCLLEDLSEAQEHIEHWWVNVCDATLQFWNAGLEDMCSYTWVHGLPFRNGGNAVPYPCVVLGYKLGLARDKEGGPIDIVNIPGASVTLVPSYQLIILAVNGLVCLTALIPPRRSTSFFTPSTCTRASRMSPFPYLIAAC